MSCLNEFAAKSDLPRPRCVLHVGVVASDGERDSDITGARLFLTSAAEIANQLRMLTDSFYQPGPPLLRCVSALGNDASRAFAKQSLSDGWELQVVLSRPVLEDASLLEQAGAVMDLGGDFSHRAAEEIILDHSDVLVVVSNDAAACMEMEIVRNAHARGVTVFMVDTVEAEGIRVLGRFGTSTSPWQDELREGISRILSPASLAQRHWQWFEGTKRLPRRSTKIIAQLHRIVLGVFTLGVPSSTTAPIAKAPPVNFNELLETHFWYANSVAQHNGDVYRSISVLRYLLILPATLAGLGGFFFPSPWSEASMVMQAAVIAAAVIMGLLDRRHHWHENFVETRLLAELLRHQRVMSEIGRAVVTIGVPEHRKGEQIPWTGWYLRALIRDGGLVTGRPDWEKSRQNVAAALDDQISFYSARRHVFAALARRLGIIGQAMFIAGMVTIIARAIAFPMLPETWTEVRQWVNLACILLPSFAPVFMGLRSQGEYDRLARHYAAISESLFNLHSLLRSEGASPQRLSTIAQTSVEFMLSEVTDWRNLTRARPIPL